MKGAEPMRKCSDKPALQELNEDKVFETISIYRTRTANDFYNPKLIEQDRELSKLICQRFGTSPVKVPEKKTTICYFDSLVHNWNDCVDEFYRLNPELLKNGDKNNDKKK